MSLGHHLVSRSGLLLFTLAVIGPSATALGEERSPNFLFIITDDQSFETLGHLNQIDIETPNLDRLARQGTSFSRCYNMGSWSGAVCIASRTMLNTGRFLWNANAVQKQLRKEHAEGRLWSDMLKGQGYRTYLTGKWHVSIDANKVFDVARNVRPGMPKQTDAGYNRPPLEGDDPWQPWDKKRGGFWEGGTHWSEVVANDAIDFIGQAEKQPEPFFMYVAFNAPHDPRQAPREFVEKYPLTRIAVPENFLPNYPFKNEIGCSPSLRDEKLALFPRTEHGIQVHRQEYFACITHLDQQIGRILDRLEASKMAENTWIILTSDHGLAVGRHGLVGKQNMYDHSMRVPFIIVGPKAKSGATITDPIYLQDVVPTTLELAGLTPPAHVEFKSLLPKLTGESTQPQHLPIIGAYLDKQRMIFDGKYKLIVYPKVPTVRLYQLENDPFEKHDLAKQPGAQAKLKELFQLLLKWQDANGDPNSLKKQFPDLAKD